MKNFIAITIAATGLIIFVFGMEGNAQSGKRVVADIPFDFYVRNEKMPAGKYEFETASRHAHPGALIVRSIGNPVRRSVIVGATADRGVPDSRIGLVFNRYGSAHYLSVVELDASNWALKLMRTRRENELADRLQEPLRVTIIPTSVSAN